MGVDTYSKGKIKKIPSKIIMIDTARLIIAKFSKINPVLFIYVISLP